MVTTERVIEYPFVFQNLEGTNGLLLDIGGGSSGLAIALASRGFQVVEFDVYPYPYRHPNLLAARGDAMHLPFATGSFGVALAISVIEHIGLGHYGDPLAKHGDLMAVTEITRVLKPGGRTLITVPFGLARIDDFQRVYDPSSLGGLLAPLTIVRVEYAWSKLGLWTPCTETEAVTVDWSGPDRAVAMVVAISPPR